MAHQRAQGRAGAVVLSPDRLVSAAMASVCSAAAVLTVLALGVSPAAAEQKCTYVGIILKCVEVTPGGTPGQPGDSGSSEPTCDLDSVQPSEYDKNRTANFCSGTEVCYTRDLLPPLALPAGEPPNKDSVARSTMCSDGATTRAARVFWSDDEEPPTPLEQARTAIDALDFTTPTVGVSPAARTLVNLDTWFWLEDVQPEVTASAFTVTATARLRTMTVDPGDGSGTFACNPVPTTAAAAAESCLKQYRKASVRGGASVDGRPAYEATVTTLYDLSFTLGGDPTTIAGAPTTIDGLPATVAVRVDEAQTVVRPNR